MSQPDAGFEEPPPIASVMIEPRHGQLFDGATAGRQVSFAGYSAEPGTGIEIQTLSNPADLTSWVAIATATASTEPSIGEDDDALYSWEVAAAPAAVNLARWPQGGLVRVRAIEADGTIASVFPHDADSCFAEHPGASMPLLVQRCAHAVTNGAVLVSPSPTPGEQLDRPVFLDRKGAGSPAETLEYYAATDAPATITDFRARYEMDGADEVTAAYYNSGDLAVGREMHCATFTSPTGTGLACYSSNYGEFSGSMEDGLARAVEGHRVGGAAGAFATVAMVYTPPITAPNSVSFVVYGANGSQVTEAVLDTVGDNISIPNNCVNCHGGNSSYDPATNQLLGARFLPFDRKAFAISSEPGYTYDSMAPRFRQLNNLVLGASPAPAISELIAGMNSEGDEFVPPGWTETREAAATYKHAVAGFCRGCHASYVPAVAGIDLSFQDHATFRNLGSLIGTQVCGVAGDSASHLMPNAEVVLDNFWRSSARAYLVDRLEIAGSCAPR